MLKTGKNIQTTREAHDGAHQHHEHGRERNLADLAKDNLDVDDT